MSLLLRILGIGALVAGGLTLALAALAAAILLGPLVFWLAWNVLDFGPGLGLSELGFWAIVLATLFLVVGWLGKVLITGIVIIVQNSLALAFALAGIAGAVRFKNSLKSSGDALFILVSVGIGLAGGIGAVELALVLSIAFNTAFLLLWSTEYGEREGMKRYMADLDAPPEGEAAVRPDRSGDQMRPDGESVECLPQSAAAA